MAGSYLQTKHWFCVRCEEQTWWECRVLAEKWLHVPSVDVRNIQTRRVL